MPANVPVSCLNDQLGCWEWAPASGDVSGLSVGVYRPSAGPSAAIGRRPGAAARGPWGSSGVLFGVVACVRGGERSLREGSGGVVHLYGDALGGHRRQPGGSRGLLPPCGDPLGGHPPLRGPSRGGIDAYEVSLGGGFIPPGTLSGGIHPSQVPLGGRFTPAGTLSGGDSPLRGPPRGGSTRPGTLSGVFDASRGAVGGRSACTGALWGGIWPLRGPCRGRIASIRSLYGVSGTPKFMNQGCLDPGSGPYRGCRGAIWWSGHPDGADLAPYRRQQVPPVASMRRNTP